MNYTESELSQLNSQSTTLTVYLYDYEGGKTKHLGANSSESINALVSFLELRKRGLTEEDNPRITSVETQNGKDCFGYTPYKDLDKKQREIVDIQAEQLEEWKLKLNAECFEALLGWVKECNRQLTLGSRYFNPIDEVTRGSDFDQFIVNWKPKGYVHKHSFQ